MRGIQKDASQYEIGRLPFMLMVGRALLIDEGKGCDEC
jgi:hypothetical protein